MLSNIFWFAFLSLWCFHSAECVNFHDVLAKLNTKKNPPQQPPKANPHKSVLQHSRLPIPSSKLPSPSKLIPSKLPIPSRVGNSSTQAGKEGGLQPVSQLGMTQRQGRGGDGLQRFESFRNAPQNKSFRRAADDLPVTAKLRRNTSTRSSGYKQRPILGKCLEDLEILSYSGSSVMTGLYYLNPNHKFFKLTTSESGDELYLATKSHSDVTDDPCNNRLRSLASRFYFDVKRFRNTVSIEVPLLRKLYHFDMPTKTVNVDGSSNGQKQELDFAVQETIIELSDCLNEDAFSSPQDCANWVFRAYIIHSVADTVETTVTSFNLDAQGMVSTIQFADGKISFFTQLRNGALNMHSLKFRIKGEKSVLYNLQEAVAQKYFTKSSIFEYKLDNFELSWNGDFFQNRFGMKICEHISLGKTAKLSQRR